MGKFVNNNEEFFKYCEENEVQFVDFRFSDLKGMWHHLTYMMDAVTADQLSFGMPFDGSSVDAWQPINKSDMILRPDVETAFLDPFTADSTIIVICDVYDIYKGQMYEKCPRSIAKKALTHLSESGVGDVAYFGPENEFFIFDDVKIIDSINESYYKVDSDEGEWSDSTEMEVGNTGHRPRTKGGYFPVQPTDSMVDLRAEMMQVLKQVGLEVILGHHEVAQAQGEIGVVFDGLIEAADNVQKYKYVCKMVAHLNGKSCTFMPKPLYGDNGNGMHVHQSLSKDGENIFAGDLYGGLSETALFYIGGIIKHAKAINAFANASTNSYKRLIPGFEAPVMLAYSSRNRSASIRIPHTPAKARRLEIRFGDSTANPYLAFAAMLMAGLDGIQNQIHPGDASDKDLYDLSSEEEAQIPQVAFSFDEALKALDEDRSFLTAGGVFDDDMIDAYIELKMEEVTRLRMATHPAEFDMYYSL